MKTDEEVVSPGEEILQMYEKHAGSLRISKSNRGMLRGFIDVALAGARLGGEIRPRTTTCDKCRTKHTENRCPRCGYPGK